MNFSRSSSPSTILCLDQACSCIAVFIRWALSRSGSPSTILWLEQACSCIAVLIRWALSRSKIGSLFIGQIPTAPRQAMRGLFLLSHSPVCFIFAVFSWHAPVPASFRLSSSRGLSLLFLLRGEAICREVRLSLFDGLFALEDSVALVTHRLNSQGRSLASLMEAWFIGSLIGYCGVLLQLSFSHVAVFFLTVGSVKWRFDVTQLQ